MSEVIYSTEKIRKIEELADKTATKVAVRVIAILIMVIGLVVLRLI